jgi:dephospho-CoA kinase
VAAAPFIGLTGAIAAGKSEALAALDRLGAATLSSDAVVHELLSSERVRDLLVDRWGPSVAPNGTVDRGRVGTIVFERPEELAWLESALHPLVGERIRAWREALPEGTPLAVVEVPLLFETGLDAHFDGAGERGTDALEGRAARQLSQAEKAARATYVVRNDGTVEELEAALGQLIAKLAASGERPI